MRSCYISKYSIRLTVNYTYLNSNIMKNKTTLNFLISTVLFLGMILTMQSQLQNANWHLGNQVFLNFNDGTQLPTINTNATTLSVNYTNLQNNGGSTVSDESGNLLFYTDGVNVWNRSHTLPIDGTDLSGCTSVSQSVLIVPNPANAEEYYIFTNQGSITGSLGLNYSMVSTNSTVADGTVIRTTRNTNLLPIASEKMTTVLNPNDNSYWVVAFAPSTNARISDTFYAYKIDRTGVNLINQSTFNFAFAPNTQFSGGQMKISPDLSTLAMAHNTIVSHERYGIQNYTSLFSFDFDILTGVVSSLNQEFVANDLNFYGIEFSPDSNLLYATGTHTLSDQSVYPVHEIEVGRLYQIPYKNIRYGNTWRNSL